jgi:transcriptional regulator with XRE-family HTH domain
MDDKSDIAGRIREERARIGMRQDEFATLAGVKRGTIGQWEKGTNFPNAAVLQSAAAAGFDVAYIITGLRSAGSLSGPAAAPAGDADAIYLPLLGATGSMGPGNDTLEDVIVAELPVSRHWLSMHLPRCRPEALQLVHAYGDSMGETLNSGDFAIVDTDCTVADVNGVYVLEVQDKLYIKRVTARLDGTKEISSDNPNVRTVEVLNGSHAVRICGRVVYGWNGRRF